MQTSADVIIIGAGVHGASVAFHLAERGLFPLVLERRYIAAGSTGRSSGLVRMHYDFEPEAQLAWHSYQYFTNWGDRVADDCYFIRTGFLQFTPIEFTQQLEANVAMLQRLGIPSSLVSAEEVNALAPSFFVDDIQYAAYEPESGYADPNSTTSAFIDAAKAYGAKIVQNCQVTGVRTKGGRISGVESSQGDFSAPIIVNAAGPWAGEIASMVDLEIPINTWRHDVMFVHRQPDIVPTHPTVIDSANSMYFRPETGDLTLVGLEDGNPLGESPDGFTDRARLGYIERAIERICLRIPAMQSAHVQSSHAGYDGITPDQKPILGPAGPEGFFLQCGFSGTGFKISPAVGACMAEWIIDGHSKTVDITMFNLDRFERGEHLKGEHAYDDTWH